MEEILSSLPATISSCVWVRQSEQSARCDSPDESQLRDKICGWILENYFSVEEKKQLRRMKKPFKMC